LAVFFKRQFERNCKQPSSDEDVDMEDDMDDSTTQDEEGVSVFSTVEMSMMIKQLHWIGVVDEALMEMLCAQIEHRITEQCKGELDEPALEDLCSWLKTSIFAWLAEVLETKRESSSSMGSVGEAKQAGEMRSMLMQRQTRLEFFLYEVYCDLRINELFDIITDFPDSMPCLEDLRTCLERTQQHRELVASLRLALGRRLLHPGANTSQIIDVYISTIKVHTPHTAHHTAHCAPCVFC
jgi:anaphase-promoting complex subunit 2